MRTRRAAATIVALGAVPTAVAGLTAGTAYAHGTMESPISRAYACYQENPESPKSAACKAAVAAGGTQALYDWNGIRQGDAGGRSREIIPDGKLCSGGNDEFKGLDLARADWPATKLTSGASSTFRYLATAPHEGGFQLYVTNDHYDPAKPLKWSDLESKPFLTVDHPALTDGAYTLTGKLPAGKKGRQLIYAIQQRTDSPEAFYSCSDVDFGGGSAGTAPGTAAPKPTASSTRTPAPGCGGGHSHDGMSMGGTTDLHGRNVASSEPTGPSGGLSLGTAVLAVVALCEAAMLLVLTRRRNPGARHLIGPRHRA
jgi:chitin-binding protein